MNVFTLLGRKTLNFLGQLGAVVLFLLAILLRSAAVLKRPRLSVRQMYFAGVLSIIIIAVSGLFVGMVLGLQGYTQLSKFKAADALG